MAINEKKYKIAVVGAGISGLTVAYLLDKQHEITIYEQNEYLGGHTNTRFVNDSSGKLIAVDTGFIVCNPQNYPNFYKLLAQLKVGLRDTEMSFGLYSEKHKLQYKGPAWYEFISEPMNFLRKDFRKLISQQIRFNKAVLHDLKNDNITNITLGDYIKRLGCDEFFIENYLVPLIAAIWSSPSLNVQSFPALSFARFFKNHGMLELNKRPRWQTIIGGSQVYVRALMAKLKAKIHTNCPISDIRRMDSSVQITVNNQLENFDYIVLATHADQSLALLSDSSDVETKLLSTWSYSKNKVVLHSDSTVLPGKSRLWAAWNYLATNNQNTISQPVQISYYMNKLQDLPTKDHFFVTLNPTTTINPNLIHFQTEYTHPIYTPEAYASQKALKDINGNNRTFYCGAYMGYGFHEDGVVSGVNVAKHFGIEL